MFSISASDYERMVIYNYADFKGNYGCDNPNALLKIKNREVYYFKSKDPETFWLAVSLYKDGDGKITTDAKKVGFLSEGFDSLWNAGNIEGAVSDCGFLLQIA